MCGVHHERYNHENNEKLQEERYKIQLNECEGCELSRVARAITLRKEQHQNEMKNGRRPQVRGGERR